VSDLADLIEVVADLKVALAETRTLVRNMVRTGTVEERDATKGYRLNWGKDDQGKTILSPWYPHPESGGGAKTSFPLTKGQTVTAINPGGDARQGFLVRGGYSDQNPSPSSSLDENVFTFKDVKVEAADGKLKLTVGGTAIELGAGKISLKSAAIEMVKG
jgi:phage baseplate assembly protein gpV